MGSFHRHNTDKLRQRVIAATLAAEHLTLEADIAAEHGEVSFELAHQFRMILRSLQQVEERVRHACDIQMAYEPWTTYCDSTYEAAS